MTVKELIEELQKLNPTDLVVMSSDSEGNSYSPLSGLWEGSYVEESSYRGEAWLRELTEEYKKHGYTEEDVRADGIKAVFLAPIN